jgi:hypothetical protein
MGGHLVYAASVGSGRDQGLAVGAVQLPGPKVDETVAALDREALMIIKPGTAVRLSVNAGTHQRQVEAALQRKIEANGWKLSPQAATVVIAEMKRGETHQTSYRFFGGGATQTVSVTPFLSLLRIEVGPKVAWESGTSTGAPPVMTLREGESMQNVINSYQRPNPEFYELVEIPASILDPDKRNGLGTTEVTNRGLVVQ